MINLQHRDIRFFRGLRASIIALGFCVHGSHAQDLAVPTFKPLPARAIGLLVSRAEDVLAAEGRYGPPNAVVFGADRSSYRWVYLHALPTETAEATSISIRIAGQSERSFENVILATDSSLARRRIVGEYRLARMTVNDGAGSADVDTLVASEIEVIDGTSEFAAVSVPISSTIRQCHAKITVNQALKTALEELKSSVRSTAEWTSQTTILPLVTWLSESREIEIVCDGELSVMESRAGIGIVPDGTGQQSGPPLVQYGLKLSARVRLRYLIGQSGTVRAVPEGPIQTSIRDLPPPGGPAPR